MELDIKKGNNLLYIEDDSHKVLAELTYVPKGVGEIIIEHVFVSNTLRGQGIGNQLVDKAVEYSRQNNLKIIPQCSYAYKVMHENEKYKDVLVQ